MTLDEFQDSLFNQIARIGNKPFKVRDSEGVLHKVTGFELEEYTNWDEVKDWDDYYGNIEYVELVLKYEP